MTRNNKQLIAELILLLALVPALAGYYFNYKGRWILSLLCYTLSVSTLCVPVFMFFAFRIIQHCMPLILSTLASLNRTLLPVVKTISETKVVGPAISLFIRFNFFVCFMMILMTDQIIRSVLGRVAGLHTSQRYLCKFHLERKKK
jgi:hypothetical protein